MYGPVRQYRLGTSMVRRGSTVRVRQRALQKPRQAMACGTLVVATGEGGPAQLLAAEENCILVAPDSPAEIAALRRAPGGSAFTAAWPASPKHHLDPGLRAESDLRCRRH